MTKSEKHCSHCGGKFGLICYPHWGLRFCRKASKDSLIAKAAKDYARLRKWLGFSPRFGGLALKRGAAKSLELVRRRRGVGRLCDRPAGLRRLHLYVQ